MYHKLMNVMSMHANLALNNLSMMRIGTVSSYDPSTYSVKVLIQPEGVESEWMPILTPMAGNQWGIYTPPNLGDCAVIGYEDGDKESGFLMGYFYNDVDRPVSVETGEIQIINKAGTKIILKANGDIELNCSTRNINAICNTFTINGDLHVTGEVKDHKGTMDEMRSIYNSHTHPDPQGDNTSAPNQPM